MSHLYKQVKTNQTRMNRVKLLERFTSWASVIAGIIALMITSLSLLDLRTNAGLSPSNGTEAELAMKAQIENINSEIMSIKQEQAKLIEQINALSQPTSETALTRDITNLRSSVNDVDERLAKIEGIIVQDPQEALEVPFLRKDLENVSSTTELQISDLRQDVERSYNLMLVTIVALAVAVLAPALSNLFRKNREEQQ